MAMSILIQPNDKLVGREGSPEDFVQVADTSAEDLPWK